MNNTHSHHHEHLTQLFVLLIAMPIIILVCTSFTDYLIIVFILPKILSTEEDELQLNVIFVKEDILQGRQ